MKQLCYFHPNSTMGHSTFSPAQEEHPDWLAWLNLLVEKSPEVIFFYTIETTDI